MPATARVARVTHLGVPTYTCPLALPFQYCEGPAGARRALGRQHATGVRATGATARGLIQTRRVVLRVCNLATERRASSVSRGRRIVFGIEKTLSWISGARRSRPMTCVTRARVTPSRRAISAWLATSPDSNMARHAWALRSSSATRGGRGSLRGLGLPRRGGAPVTTRLAGTRRVSVAELPAGNVGLGPRATSTAWSRYAVGAWRSAPATWTIRKTTVGPERSRLTGQLAILRSTPTAKVRTLLRAG